MQRLLTPLDAGRLLGISSDAVRYQEHMGHLRAVRDSEGNRLFKESAVLKLKAQRETKQAAKKAALSK